MILNHRQKFIAAAALVASLALPAFAAERRHSSSTPGRKDLPEAVATLTGHVYDAETGAPVVNADVAANNGRTMTKSDGSYAFNVLTAPKQVLLTVTRTGYETATSTVTIDTGANAVADFRLKPTSTVRLTEVDGTVHTLDFDSVQFAYLISFSGYARSDAANFCKSDGTPFTPNRSEFKQILGPAISVNSSACCTLGPVVATTVQMKNGDMLTVNFADSCYGNEVDFIGREHVSGEYAYFNFTKIAKIEFP